MGIAFNFEEIIRIGIEIENNGCEFYNKALEKVDDLNAKKALGKLAKWEVEHTSIFEGILKDEQNPGCAVDSWYEDETSMQYFKSIADSHIFSTSSVGELIEGCETALDIFRVALQFEKDSIVLYESLKNMVSPSCGDREKVQKIIDEEIMHIGYIQKEIQSIPL